MKTYKEEDVLAFVNWIDREMFEKKWLAEKGWETDNFDTKYPLTYTAKELFQLFLKERYPEIFNENDIVIFKDKPYHFKEQNVDKVLIANSTTDKYHEYNDWWVDYDDIKREKEYYGKSL